MKPPKQQLEEAKINLYKILEQFDEFELSTSDADLFYQLSCDSVIDEYLNDKFV